MVNEIIEDNQTSYWIEVSPVTSTVPELMCSKCGYRISFYGLYPRTCVICGSNMSNGITIHTTNYIETPGVHYYQT